MLDCFLHTFVFCLELPNALTAVMTVLCTSSEHLLFINSMSEPSSIFNILLYIPFKMSYMAIWLGLRMIEWSQQKIYRYLCRVPVLASQIKVISKSIVSNGSVIMTAVIASSCIGVN